MSEQNTNTVNLNNGEFNPPGLEVFKKLYSTVGSHTGKDTNLYHINNTPEPQTKITTVERYQIEFRVEYKYHRKEDKVELIRIDKYYDLEDVFNPDLLDYLQDATREQELNP